MLARGDHIRQVLDDRLNQPGPLVLHLPASCCRIRDGIVKRRDRRVAPVLQRLNCIHVNWEVPRQGLGELYGSCRSGNRRSLCKGGYRFTPSEQLRDAGSVRHLTVRLLQLFDNLRCDER